MRGFVSRVALAVLAGLTLAGAARAQDDANGGAGGRKLGARDHVSADPADRDSARTSGSSASSDSRSAADRTAGDFPPFPADHSAKQTARVAGRTVAYTATVGSLPVRDEKGKIVAQVVFTAYTLDGTQPANRPVTFAFNGGPGAASVYLNLGAIGPKRIQFGAEGDSPSDPVRLVDNATSWLDFTDLVFIDPVGTGFSRSLVSDEDSKKRFYATKPDIEYLSRIVYDWLLKNGRMASPKYVAGESYGGFRGPRITHFLQTRLGVGVNGLVLVSPYLESASEAAADFSPMAWLTTLPSIIAANLERQGRLTPEAMAEVEAYVRGEYATALLRGRSDPAGQAQMIARVTELTGLDPAFVRRSGGRIETQAYLREVYRTTGKLGSRYDSNVKAWDPFPYAPAQRTNDPILDAIIAPTTSAMVDFVTRTVGWKVDARYNALSYDVGRMWNDGHEEAVKSVTDLRQAVAIDPKLKVLIAHGWDDLSCPFFASVMIVDQMPVMGDPQRVRVAEYPGGHMFYSRPDSAAAFRRDVMSVYGAR